MSASIPERYQKVGAFCCGMAFFALMSVVGKSGELSDSGVRGLIQKNSLSSALASSSPALADGCHHVFIDAGSNRGVHGRFLFEPGHYPLSKFVPLFDEMFGKIRKDQDICVFAFEPNPLHAARQTEISKSYAKMGWRYHFMPYAVMDEPGELTFYRNTDAAAGTDEKEEWGFGANNWKGRANEENKVVVPVVDLSAWLMENVFSRTLPTKSSKNNRGPPRVFMKMDIEGAEWHVLPKLVKDGTICKFDKIVGETHPMQEPMLPNPMLVQKYKALRLVGKKARFHFVDSLADVMLAAGCAPFELYDDESYLHDGAPLPV